jgi:hypothetical protein
MRRGRAFERTAFDMLADERPDYDVVRASVQVIDEETRQACTPDGFVRAPDRDGIGAVEAKVVARSIYRERWLDDPSDSIYGSATPPPDKHLQVLEVMKLNNLTWGVMPVLIVGEYGHDFVVHEIERNQVLEDRIDYHVARFLREYLDPGIMPPFEPLRDAQLIRALYPRDTGAMVDLRTDNRALALVDDLVEVQAGLKRARDQETAIKAELESKLQEATFGILADGRCLSWKTTNRKAYSVEPSSYRVLRVLKHTPEELTR